MTVYCLTGLGADTSVFDLLELDYPKVCIEWIPTHPWENMTSYAWRLCAQVDATKPFVLLGVSFGGMLAVEMNKYIKPEKTILVTSSARRSELPLWIRLIAKTKLNRVLPTFLFGSNPKWLIWYFGIKSEQGQKMVTAIAKKADRYFTKLSIDKVLTWDNEWLPENLIRIHAKKDKLLPAPSHVHGVEIPDQGHFAIVESAKEISRIINDLLSESN